MLFKISCRNALRSVKDYFVYLSTMSIVAGLMFAFNTMVFSEDVQKMSEMASMMGVILIITTVFIIFIAAWLINYMVRFMLEKKNREFATYMLLGIKRKKIATIYFCENLVIGCVAFLAGLLIGVVLQQLLMVIFYTIMNLNYKISITFNSKCLLLTFLCYCSCYLFAIARNQRKFKKMNIHVLMSIDKKNQELQESGEQVKQWFFLLSVLYLVFFIYNVFQFNFSGISIWIYTGLFILAFYIIYIGGAAYLVQYIRKHKDGVYHDSNLFIMRQLSSKIKNMSFTMGTISVLLTLALLGSTVAFMLNDFQNEQLNESFPFDISIHHEAAGYGYNDEIELINDMVGISDYCTYQVYQSDTRQMNDFFYTHLNFFKGKYLEQSDIKGEQYYSYDTIIKLSDYNHLRAMLGYDEVSLLPQEYILQTKERIKAEIFPSITKLDYRVGQCSLKSKGCISIPFCQNGHNGADYIIVVSDENTNNMKPYYSQLAVKTKSVPDTTLWNMLSKQNDSKIEAIGTDIIMYSDNTLIKNIAITEMKFTLTFLIFPLFYIGLIFLCVAMTVLSVQQLSDSNKYRFRYRVLRNLGLNNSQINKVILKQLACFYLCPMMLSVIISVPIAMFISIQFVAYTGIHAIVWQYWMYSLIAFIGIYMLYFIVTYQEYKHNIQE